MCNCRNSTFVLITALITVYFSNISSQLASLLCLLLQTLAFAGGCSSSQKSTLFREPFFGLRSFLLPKREPIQYITAIPFCQAFFQLFSKSFSPPIYPAARDSLIILPHIPPFVNQLFLQNLLYMEPLLMWNMLNKIRKHCKFTYKMGFYS